MNTEQTAQQLELAAQIIRTGHPWEIRPLYAKEWRTPSDKTWPAFYICHDYEIRLALATPPDNRPLHNPDNLTAAQVGIGYRLLLPEEVDGRHKGKCRVWNGFNAWSSNEAVGTHVRYSYRLPLSVPWPTVQAKPQITEEQRKQGYEQYGFGAGITVVEKPDPYADLKAAHAAGKMIQIKVSEEFWEERERPLWDSPVECYRIKPEPPPFQLPPPPPGMQWHRTDGWRAEDLPPGTRPLVLEEHSTNAAQQRYTGGWMRLSDSLIANPLEEPIRTTRPLTFTHEGKTWTWHRPGDPMPCDRERRIHIICHEGRTEDQTGCRYLDRLARNNLWDKTLGWRYADEKKTVPLGPEDVPPGSVFRRKSRRDQSDHWISAAAVSSKAVIVGYRSTTYSAIKDELEINRSTPLTGKWNPNAWEPCHKTIPENG